MVSKYKKTVSMILICILTIHTIHDTQAAFCTNDCKIFKREEKLEEDIPPEENFLPKRGNDAPPAAPTGLTTAQGWYFNKTKDNTQPPLSADLSYITKYNGYWLDTKHNSIEDEDKVIYLTFDAGYENGNIEKILDILKTENVPAAFFILKNLVIKDTTLVKRMIEEGHMVCNHTANHKDMTKAADFESFRCELEEMEKIYTEITGEKLAPYYRPPEGKTSEQTMKWTNDLGYKTIFWSFAYADWDNNNQMSPEKACEKILAHTHNGEVILLHPTSATNAEILDDLIHTWKERGFRFGTLDELTQD